MTGSPLRSEPGAPERLRCEGPPLATLSVCCITRGPSARVAGQLELLRGVADEIVVAADDRIDPELMQPLADVADRVVLYPYEDPVDRPVGWAHSLCTGGWILWLDDDEIPSRRLLDELPDLISQTDVTHYWLLRRWLYRDSATMVDDPPWYPDYQLRLVRNDPALLWYPGITHWPIEAVGPSRYVEAPIFHTDLLLNPPTARREKSRRYEAAHPGKRLGGLSLNQACYLPERRDRLSLVQVPDEDVQVIDALLARDPWGDRRPPVVGVRHAERDEVDRLWYGRAPTEDLYRARLEIRGAPSSLAARATHALAVVVHNEGSDVWPWGTLGSPEIRLSYRWWTNYGRLVPCEELRTPFPHPIAPGAHALVLASVTAPAKPGEYVLELDLVHEHVRWFGTQLRLDVAVAPQPLVLLAGADEPTLTRLAATFAEAAPEVEPALVGMPYRVDGYRAVPSARGYLLETGSLSRPAMLARAFTLVVAARLLRRGSTRVGAAADFLGALSEATLVLDLGSRGTPRERFQHRVGLLAARALNVPVVAVSDDAQAVELVQAASAK